MKGDALMQIIQLPVGPLGTNCYLVISSRDKQAMVIDPGGNPEAILRVLREHAATLTHIVNTHGHADHIAACGLLAAATGAQVYIHEADAAMLTNPQRNLSLFIGENVVLSPADVLLQADDRLQVGQLLFTVLHTPGHTPGGISLYGEGVLFSGDTLFAESVGRTDFPGGSPEQLLASIREKLFPLPDDTKVFPGHGPQTTIGWEKQHNPFIF